MRVEVLDADALLLQGVLDRVRRLGLEELSGPATFPCARDLGDQSKAELLRLGLAHHDHGGGAVEICDEVPAVIVPALANAGRSLPS
ncbi:hypothetical protein [Streptomyces sp. KL116D]|uniref:hypothetical protein n=1 Tax=Streptomyces sp. KL116D TaxID=3045152 RepID=UPI003557994C